MHRKASKGVMIEPTFLLILHSSWRSSSELMDTTPPKESLCPDRYFVVLCRETQAPFLRGLYRSGVVNVPSTTSREPVSLHLRAILFMSRTRSRGLVIVSTTTMRTFRSILSMRASVSGPPKIVLIPNLERSRASSCVTPYDSFPMSTVSPDCSDER